MSRDDIGLYFNTIPSEEEGELLGWAESQSGERATDGGRPNGLNGLIM